MLCSKEELLVYKSFYESIQNGNVKPYDKELIDKLKTHKNKYDPNMDNYFDALCSSYSIGKSYLFSNYLMIFLDNKKYKLCEGYLSSFIDKKFKHTWIESDKEVLDVTFLGKWNKNEYYNIFKPVIEKENDYKDLKNLKENTIEVYKKSNGNFKYIDWYNYMKNNTISTQSMREDLKIKTFPVLTKKNE